MAVMVYKNGAWQDAATIQKAPGGVWAEAEGVKRFDGQNWVECAKKRLYFIKSRVVVFHHNIPVGPYMPTLQNINTYNMVDMADSRLGLDAENRIRVVSNSNGEFRVIFYFQPQTLRQIFSNYKKAAIQTSTDQTINSLSIDLRMEHSRGAGAGHGVFAKKMELKKSNERSCEYALEAWPWGDTGGDSSSRDYDAVNLTISQLRQTNAPYWLYMDNFYLEE